MAPDVQTPLPTKDFASVPIVPHIEHDQQRITVKLANMMGVGQAKLSSAQGILDNAAGVAVAKLGKEALSTLLAPAREIVAILDVVAQVHPAISIAIAVVRSDMLFVLGYLDPVFQADDGLKEALESLLEKIKDKIDEFVRTLFSGRYKGPLDDFAQAFSGLKDDLRFLVLSKSAATTTDIKDTLDRVSVKVDKVVAFLDKLSPEEKRVVDAVQQRGEAAVFEDERFISSLASKLGDKMNSDIRKDIKFTFRTDLEEALENNRSLYVLQFEAVQLRIENLIVRSTSTILLHMDAGPHDLIRDEDIRTVWKVTEVDQFFQNKPQSWSSAEWIAFWAVGWYKNAIMNRCSAIISELRDMYLSVLPQNKQYLEYYFGEDGLTKISSIYESIHTDVLTYHAERSTDPNDKLHQLRTEAMKRDIEAMKLRLVAPKYQLDDLHAVFAVCRSSQLELRHKKIIDLSKKLVLSEEEFDAMDSTLWSINEAFDKRYRDLVEGWRQQRVDVDLQVQSFAAGLYEDWHQTYEEDLDDDSDTDSEINTDGGLLALVMDATGDSDAKPDANGERTDEDVRAEAVDESAGDEEPADEAENPDNDSNEGGDEAEGDADEAEADEADADDASAVEELLSVDGGHADVLQILVFPLPEQPETADVQEITADEAEEEEDDEGQMVETKVKKGTRLERRVTAIETKVTAIETKLDGIEKLLREVLAACTKRDDNDVDE
ncbi:hypothetical protein HWV62_39349 [Athelia sp. TMB]|nr:hypothetical protein HWV62_39349 [Athelia sp. TMB]